MDIGFLIIAGMFVLYYLLLVIFPRKLLSNPIEIIEKLFSIALIYAGISLVYFALMGKPFLSDSLETYQFYIFMIGVIAIFWSVPDLLEEFNFYKKYFKKKK